MKRNQFLFWNRRDVKVDWGEKVLKGVLEGRNLFDMSMIPLFVVEIGVNGSGGSGLHKEEDLASLSSDH